jgi:hypothetical protein
MTPQVGCRQSVGVRTFGRIFYWLTFTPFTKNIVNGLIEIVKIHDRLVRRVKKPSPPAQLKFKDLPNSRHKTIGIISIKQRWPLKFFGYPWHNLSAVALLGRSAPPSCVGRVAGPATPRYSGFCPSSTRTETGPNSRLRRDAICCRGTWPFEAEGNTLIPTKRPSSAPELIKSGSRGHLRARQLPPGVHRQPPRFRRGRTM